MTRLSELRLAQVSIGVLLLVVVRSLSEFFRLHYLHGEALVIGQVTPYIAGELFATVALALTVISYFASLDRTSMAITATTLILLFVYKVAVVG
jgi:hypothetical protein